MEIKSTTTNNLNHHDTNINREEMTLTMIRCLALGSICFTALYMSGTLSSSQSIGVTAAEVIEVSATRTVPNLAPGMALGVIALAAIVAVAVQNTGLPIDGFEGIDLDLL